MENRKSTKLIIISLPFYRIARVTLSQIMLQFLLSKNDTEVLVICPFANEPGIQRSFKEERLKFLRIDFSSLNRLKLLLLGVSEMLRRNGYWRRFRHSGFSYYLRNQYITYQADGNDKVLPISKRFLTYILSKFGVFRNAWKFFDRFIWNKVYQNDPIKKIANQYSDVILIQSASWGNQDRYLSYLSKKQNFRKVLIPYTTDQLSINGYLMNDFDSICVQGPFERKMALKNHLIDPEKIFNLGSIWFRYIDFIRSQKKTEYYTSPKNENAILLNPKRIIMYAGLAAPFFPSESEFLAVDMIVQMIETGMLKNCCLVYRPLVTEDDKKDIIVKRYAGKSEIKLQFPDHSSIGLSEYKEVNQLKSIENHIEQMSNCSLVVMSWNTTLGMDIAYISKCAVIENRYDPTGVIIKRNYLEQKKLGDYDIPFADSRESLQKLIVSYFCDRNLSEKHGKDSLKLWDYPDVDFYSILEKAVFGIHKD